MIPRLESIQPQNHAARRSATMTFACPAGRAAPQGAGRIDDCRGHRGSAGAVTPLPRIERIASKTRCLGIRPCQQPTSHSDCFEKGKHPTAGRSSRDGHRGIVKFKCLLSTPVAEGGSARACGDIRRQGRRGCGSTSECPCGRTAARIFRWANGCGRRQGRSRRAAIPCRASSENRRRPGSSRPCR